MVAFTAAMQAMWDICEEAVEQKPDDTRRNSRPRCVQTNVVVTDNVSMEHVFATKDLERKIVPWSWIKYLNCWMLDAVTCVM